jgi:site-specific recombinase XerD
MVNASSSPLRMPVRASSSTTRRVNRSVSARAARSSLVAAASSRKRGSAPVDDGQVGVEQQRPGRDVGVAPLGDAGEEAAQVDQGVLDAGLGQRRPGWPRVQGQVPLVGLEVGAGELGQGADLGMVVGEPVAELAQVALDGAHGGGPQAHGYLVEVAVGGLGVGAGDAVPAGLPHRDPAWSGQGVDQLVVVEGGLQPVQHGGRSPARLGPAAPAVGVQQQRAAGEEAFGVDVLDGGPGDGGDHGQHVPLQRGVGPGRTEPRGGLLEPPPGPRLVAGGCRAQPHSRRHHEAGVDLKAAGDDQPGDERRGVLDLGRGQPLLGAHGRPAAGAVQASAVAVQDHAGDAHGHLRAFFERIAEWDYPDSPARIPVFASDRPVKDRPLPRFLDDPAAAKLLAAARALPDAFDRLAVELLARTGMRKGELLGLTVDAVVQIGSAYWLRTPVGKLHADRYIPLHPQLKTMLDQWLASRTDWQASTLLFTERGRPIPPSRVDKAVQRAAAAAGLGHVHPHQLRHTLATQAINRGMSLEAIAALLGHRSLSMTMVYARIADRTVADEYFAVTAKVQALYDQQSPRLPANAEGRQMRALRGEVHRRMLGNGYCARPVELDCHFESICESCTFFVTTIQFRLLRA